MNELFTQVLAYLFKAIVLAITGVITYYIKTALVPWLKERHLYDMIQHFVQAAEKLYLSGELGGGIDKKKYVTGLLEGKGIECTPEITALIESAVKELDWMEGEIISTMGDDPTT